MTDETKVVNLRDRQPFKPDQGEMVPPAVDGVDTLSIAALESALEQARAGKLHGVCVIGTLPENGQPMSWVQFPPGSLPRTAAMTYMGLCEAMKLRLADIADFGEETFEIEAEFDSEDDYD